MAKRKIRTARQAKIPKEVRRAIAAPRATELLLMEADWPFFPRPSQPLKLAVEALAALDAGDVDTAMEKAFRMGVWIGDYRATQALHPRIQKAEGKAWTRAYRDAKRVQSAKVANTKPEGKMIALDSDIKKRGTRTVAAVCLDHGISCAKYYKWKAANRKMSHVAR
jgi:hypothetical protein